MRCLRSGAAYTAKFAETAGVFMIAEIAGEARVDEGEPLCCGRGERAGEEGKDAFSKEAEWLPADARKLADLEGVAVMLGNIMGPKALH